MAPTVQHLQLESIWLDKTEYAAAERAFYEQQAKGGAGGDVCKLTPLAGEVAKARQKLQAVKESHQQFQSTGNPEQYNVLEVRLNEAEKFLQMLSKTVDDCVKRLSNLELKIGSLQTMKSIDTPAPDANKATKDDDDDVDLFGSDSDEDDTAAAKVREERLAAYNAKKSKKPALIAKSSIILDIKPWDDETDMKVMETEVRKIEMDGLLWGASKLVPLAYGIHKLQITCVVEDDKVSVDLLQEKIEELEDYVQSVDIAAFNKI